MPRKNERVSQDLVRGASMHKGKAEFEVLTSQSIRSAGHCELGLPA